MTLARRPFRPGAFSTLRPSRKPSKRSADPVVPEVYEALVRRAGGRCELGTLGYRSLGCQGRVHAHHRLPVQFGGRSVVTNLGLLCAKHHHFVHNWPGDGAGYGWLVGRRADPSQVPVTLGDGRRVLLTDDGRYEELA